MLSRNKKEFIDVQFCSSGIIIDSGNQYERCRNILTRIECENLLIEMKKELEKLALCERFIREGMTVLEAYLKASEH